MNSLLESDGSRGNLSCREFNSVSKLNIFKQINGEVS